tara:strand:+ start:922 stop:1269 length:348 start_codon:yes stop_codon:yes gene_type:complete
MSEYGFFNQSFCSKLEYALTDAFKESNESELKGFWCDGIQHDEFNTQKLLRDKVIKTTAWIGKDEQMRYDMLIHLGTKSLEKITRNKELDSCIPSSIEQRLEISLDDRVVEVHLT